MQLVTTPLRALALSVCLVSPVLAQSANLGGMVTGNDVDRILTLAQAYGAAERLADEDGTYIRGDMDGTVYTISFLNCNDAGANCSTVQFRAWWHSEGAHTLEQMNQWNRDRRFSAAYLDASNNATIEWDVNLAGGVTAVNFDDSIQWWQTVLRQFEDQVVTPQAPAAAATTTPNAPSK